MEKLLSANHRNSRLSFLFNYFSVIEFSANSNVHGSLKSSKPSNPSYLLSNFPPRFYEENKQETRFEKENLNFIEISFMLT